MNVAVGRAAERSRHPARPSRFPALVLAAALLSLVGCAALQPTPQPIPARTLLTARGGDCVVFLLPGRGDGPGAYVASGFAATAAANGRAADLVAVDAHMGYYAERTVVDRLREDHVAPARAAGKRVWLAGISLGGLGALLYAQRHPGEVEGVVLLAPFLGRGEALAEVEAAGSLAAWDPAGGAASAEERGLWFRLWDGIRTLTADADDGAGEAPQVVLGYGTEDRLAPSHRLLARELPAGRVFTADGGHDWPTWERLWQEITAAGLPACGEPPI